MTFPIDYDFSGPAGTVPDPPFSTFDSYGGIQQDGSGHAQTDTAGVDLIAAWDSYNPGGDQYCQVTTYTVATAADDTYITLYVRSTGYSTDVQPYGSYYAWTDCYSVITLGYHNGTDDDRVSIPISPFSAGTVLRWEANGTTMTFYVNGTSVGSFTDGNYSTGNLGLDLFAVTTIPFAIDTYEVGVPGSPPPTGVHDVSGRGSFAIAEPGWLSIALSGSAPRGNTGLAEPTDYYQIAWVSWGTALHGAMRVYYPSRFLDLVQLPAGMDTCWYFFPSGITATITELASP